MESKDGRVVWDPLPYMAMNMAEINGGYILTTYTNWEPILQKYGPYKVDPYDRYKWGDG